jgi:cysteinyl-tRNA synthetase
VLRFNNTASRSKEEFIPLEAGKAGFYSCGPTVHDLSHVGNLRAFLASDLLRRHLEVSGFQVTQVMNVTDVEDKIIAKARAAGQSRAEYVAPYEEALFADLAALRARPAEFYPRATDHIPEMVELVSQLLDSSHAYVAEDGVYYRISSFPEYGDLAGVDLAGLRPGARVATDEYQKESLSDFALWKFEDADAAAVGAVWDAPFGRGRPGWHIECSAMSMKYLGPSFDLHAGGIDLLFPHHENEVAQSMAVTGLPLARYWLHNEHLVLGSGEEMHKSLGNIVTLGQLVAAGHDPLAVRLFLVGNAHYRSRQRLEEPGLHSAGEQLRRLRDLHQRLSRLVPPQVDDARLVAEVGEARRRYRAALDDDLNLPQGLGTVFEVVREANAALDAGAVGEAGRGEVLGLLEDADRHLDVLAVEEERADPRLVAAINERERARAGGDFKRADAIRDELRREGIVLEDTPEGVRWRRIRT